MTPTSMYSFGSKGHDFCGSLYEMQALKRSMLPRVAQPFPPTSKHQVGTNLPSNYCTLTQCNARVCIGEK